MGEKREGGRKKDSEIFGMNFRSPDLGRKNGTIGGRDSIYKIKNPPFYRRDSSGHAR